MRQTRFGQAPAPPADGRRGDLLEADDIRSYLQHAIRLLVQPADASRDVPAKEPQKRSTAPMPWRR